MQNMSHLYRLMPMWHVLALHVLNLSWNFTLSGGRVQTDGCQRMVLHMDGLLVSKCEGEIYPSGWQLCEPYCLGDLDPVIMSTSMGTQILLILSPPNLQLHMNACVSVNACAQLCQVKVTSAEFG